MIRFFKPSLPPWEVIGPKIQEIVESGILTTGPWVEEFEKEFARFTNAKYAIMTSSCSSGLMLLLSTLRKKSTVLIPAMTFVATYEAAVWNHLPVIISDVNEQNGLLTAGYASQKATAKTSAIVSVDLYGQDSHMRDLNLSDSDTMRFIDAAHSLGLPLRGDACVYSLGPTKQMPCGEGGVIVTDNEEIEIEARLKRTHGHKGNLKPIVVGTNARPQEIVAMIGVHQLKSIREELEKRMELSRRYRKGLEGFEVLPPKDAATIKDFVVLTYKCDEFRRLLEEKGVPTKAYYPSLTQVPSVKVKAFCPNAEKLGNRCIALPFHTSLTDEEVSYVIDAVNDVGKSIG